MYSKKKYVVIGIIILTAVVGVLVMNKMYRNQLEDKDNQINTLQGKLDAIGNMTTVYQIVKDVKAGNQCYDYELSSVEVPEYAANENAVKDIGTVRGKYYKLSLKMGAMLTNDMFTNYKLTKDMRLMDVVFDEIPIGLEAGDYIDIRISFPLGQDYIAMSHKRVAEINGSTVKLIVGQRDFYTYESMKTDIATYAATKIYGAEYVEAGLQEAAMTYYPMNLEVLLTMIKDPNIDTGNYSKVLALRQQLEEQLLKSSKVDIAQTVTSGKLSISAKFDNAQKEYQQIQEQKERDAVQAQSQSVQAENDAQTETKQEKGE